MGATSIKLMLSSELEVDLGNSPVNSPQAQAVILCRCLVSITIRPLTLLTTLMLPRRGGPDTGVTAHLMGS